MSARTIGKRIIPPQPYTMHAVRLHADDDVIDEVTAELLDDDDVVIATATIPAGKTVGATVTVSGRTFQKSDGVRWHITEDGGYAGTISGWITAEM